MALFTSPVLAEVSGSLGGIVFSHGPGGPYMRARALVTNPNTPQQQLIRGLLSQLTSLWVNTLSQLERDAWILYAANVTLLNRIGQARNVSGLNMYVRSNVPILQALFARQDTAPPIFDLGDFTAPTATAQAAAQTLTVTFADTDEWVDEDDAALLVYASRPQNNSIEFFKGPYRFAGSIDGDLALPPTSPAVIPLPFAAVAGQNVHFRAQVIRADGRLSSDVMLVAFVGI